jgi:hypothetical protein
MRGAHSGSAIGKTLGKALTTASRILLQQSGCWRRARRDDPTTSASSAFNLPKAMLHVRSTNGHASMSKNQNNEHPRQAPGHGKAVDPQAGSPKGAVKVPGPSLDRGGGGDPHDGRAHDGLSGDDGAHQATDSLATPASGTFGPDLGAQGDTRNHAMPDAVERVTGSDTPNEGGIEGSPGGPRKRPARIPGDDDPADVLADTPDTHNAQRKSQI